MGSGGGNSNPQTQQQAAQPAQPTQPGMRYAQAQPFMGNAQGLIAEQLAKGGYGDVSGLLAAMYQPMNVGYAVDPQSGNRLYSGAAYMAALRNGLEAQGVQPNTPAANPANPANPGNLDYRD